jgi:hypothetical protein
VEQGATVNVHVTAPLCSGAREALAGAGGRAGEVRVRALCLGPAGEGGRPDLAAVGSGARRATEDSAAVAYVAGPDPTSLRFARPILDEAGIAVVVDSSGRRAISRVLAAIEDADTSQGLRESVHESLGR